MLRLSRPQTAKKRKKRKTPPPASVISPFCWNAARSTFVRRAPPTTVPRLRPLLPEERRLLLLDAEINARGVCANVPFLEAARTLATQERNAINTRLNELTAGVIT